MNYLSEEPSPHEFMAWTLVIFCSCVLALGIVFVRGKLAADGRVAVACEKIAAAMGGK